MPALYLVTTGGGLSVRQAINARRMAVSANHEFPGAVLAVKLITRAALVRCERQGANFSPAAWAILAQVKADKRTRDTEARQEQAAEARGQAREDKRQAAAAEKERIKQEAAASKRREAAALRRATKRAKKVTASVPEPEPGILFEDDDADSDAVPW